MGVHFLNDFPKMHINRAMDMLSFDVKRHPSGIWCEKKKFKTRLDFIYVKLCLLLFCSFNGF